jgi:hypothetical protein
VSDDRLAARVPQLHRAGEAFRQQRAGQIAFGIARAADDDLAAKADVISITAPLRVKMRN